MLDPTGFPEPYRVCASQSIPIRLAGRRAVRPGSLGWALPAMAPPDGDRLHIAVKFDALPQVVAADPRFLASVSADPQPTSEQPPARQPRTTLAVLVEYEDPLGTPARVATAGGAIVHAAGRAQAAWLVAQARPTSCAVLLVGPPLSTRAGVPRRPVGVHHAPSPAVGISSAEGSTYWDEALVIHYAAAPARRLASELRLAVTRSAAFCLEGQAQKVGTSLPPEAVLATVRAAGIDLSGPRALPSVGSLTTPLQLQMKGVTAQGAVTRFGFRVIAGSQAVSEHPPHLRGPVADVRQMLLEDGSLQNTGRELVFTRDVEFSSPSTAASVVTACAVNGYQAWKSPEGLQLRQLKDTGRNWARGRRPLEGES